MTISIEGEMRELLNNNLEDDCPCVLGTADANGRPEISMKGSVAVYDEQTLCYWERSKRGALENVTVNPRVVIFYRNPGKRINWRFRGTAEVIESGDVWEKVLGMIVPRELDRDPERQGVAVLVHLDEIVALSGEVLQSR